MKLSRPLVAAICSILIGGVACAPALAALGGDASSVEVDRARVKGALHVAPAADYTVHEIQTPSGLVIHEYLSASGKVFAVTWRGPGIPDLHQLLGSYYAQFEQAVSAPHYNHHQLTVQLPDLVVQSSGHLRSFYGSAWAPALVPQNFSLSNLN
jgi:Protein of unknown function (DUF2844)